MKTQKKRFFEIYFELLGKAYCLYHPIKKRIPIHYFEIELQKVAPTAHIVYVVSAIIPEETAKAYDFHTQVAKWNLELEKKLNDDEKTK